MIASTVWQKPGTDGTVDSSGLYLADCRLAVRDSLVCPRFLPHAARRVGNLLLLLFGFWVMLVQPALAGQIVGVTFGRGLYDIDPLTGNTTPILACSPCSSTYFGASGSPDVGTIFANTINVHEINVTTFQDTVVGGILNFIDLAFDRGTNTLYDTSGSALFRVNCPAVPGLCTETQVGPAFPTTHMQALGFVQGAGLYGVGDNNLYLISPSTGVATLIGFTGISPDPLGNTNVTDLAYDAGTGRLIASVGCLKQLGPGPGGTGGPCDESHPGKIYLVNRLTGGATLLNGNAPQFTGLAEVVPEPGSGLMLAGACGALLIWNSWRSRRPVKSILFLRHR